MFCCQRALFLASAGRAGGEGAACREQGSRARTRAGADLGTKHTESIRHRGQRQGLRQQGQSRSPLPSSAPTPRSLLRLPSPNIHRPLEQLSTTPGCRLGAHLHPIALQRDQGTQAVTARLLGTGSALLAEPGDSPALHPPFSWQMLNSHRESSSKKAALLLDTFLGKCYQEEPRAHYPAVAPCLTLQTLCANLPAPKSPIP